MAAVLLFLRAHWKAFAGAVLVLGLVAGVYLKGGADAAARWRPKLAVAQADLQRCRDNTAALQASLTAQNAQLQAKADADAHSLAAATEALERAQKGRGSVEGRAAALLNGPSPGADACARAEAARKQVLETLK